MVAGALLSPPVLITLSCLSFLVGLFVQPVIKRVVSEFEWRETMESGRKDQSARQKLMVLTTAVELDLVITVTLVPPTLLAAWHPLRDDFALRVGMQGGVWTALSLSLLGLALAFPFYWYAFRLVQRGAAKGGEAQRWPTYALAPFALLQQSFVLVAPCALIEASSYGGGAEGSPEPSWVSRVLHVLCAGLVRLAAVYAQLQLSRSYGQVELREALRAGDNNTWVMAAMTVLTGRPSSRASEAAVSELDVVRQGLLLKVRYGVAAAPGAGRSDPGQGDAAATGAAQGTATGAAAPGAASGAASGAAPGAAPGAASSSRGLRFAQLSPDLTELRWAYNAYLLVACVEQVELCLPPMAIADRGGVRGRRKSLQPHRPPASNANDMYGAWVCVTHHDLAFPGRQLYFGLPNRHIALRWKGGLQTAADMNFPSPLGEQRLSWLCDAVRMQHAACNTPHPPTHASSTLTLPCDAPATAVPRRRARHRRRPALLGLGARVAAAPLRGHQLRAAHLPGAAARPTTLRHAGGALPRRHTHLAAGGAAAARRRVAAGQALRRRRALRAAAARGHRARADRALLPRLRDARAEERRGGSGGGDRRSGRDGRGGGSGRGVVARTGLCVHGRALFPGEQSPSVDDRHRSRLHLAAGDPGLVHAAAIDDGRHVGSAAAALAPPSAAAEHRIVRRRAIVAAAAAAARGCAAVRRWWWWW